MNKTGITVLAVSAVIALAGCGPHSGKVKSALASQSANPAVVQEEAAIKTCLGKDLFSGRQAIIACIVPAGSKATVETCVQGVLATDKLSDKAKVEQDAANCVVSANASPTPAASNG